MSSCCGGDAGGHCARFVAFLKQSSRGFLLLRIRNFDVTAQVAARFGAATLSSYAAFYLQGQSPYFTQSPLH